MSDHIFIASIGLSPEIMFPPLQVRLLTLNGCISMEWLTVASSDNFRFRSQDNFLAIFNVSWINFSSALFLKVECMGEVQCSEQIGIF